MQLAGCDRIFENTIRILIPPLSQNFVSGVNFMVNEALGVISSYQQVEFLV
jgi:hypothetical protein